ncbi:MAG TPA: PEP-CTERM sorting domain-containing protein [Candidatus Acidoferrales bacterium]|nr:PEP-CTERM sorting domain-containing protein [Candidatus Acidoferrales bacterium]
MRKSLWIILTVLVGVIGAPNAHADACPAGNICTDYTINFTTLGGSPSPSGGFVYDDTTNQFVSFAVMWGGLGFDLTALANSPAIYMGGPACASGATGAQASLALLSACATAAMPTFWVADNFLPFMDPVGPAFFTFEDPGPHPLLAINAELLIPSSNTGDDAYGNLTVTATGTTATPEPETGILMLIGIGLLRLVMRKRTALGDPQAS